MDSLRGAWKLSLDLFVHPIEMRHGLPYIGDCEQPRGEGVIHVDGASVSNADLPADLVVSLTRADLAALGKGRLDPMRAMMTGRMRVSDMAVAFRLQSQIQALFEMAT